jgi:hypothetical protein
MQILILLNIANKTLPLKLRFFTDYGDVHADNRLELENSNGLRSILGTENRLVLDELASV